MRAVEAGKGSIGCSRSTKQGLVDGFHDGSPGRWRRFRLWNVLHDLNREEFSIEVDFSLPAERVIRSLN